MAISLSDEQRKQALVSIHRFWVEELELELGGIEEARLLDFLLREIGPSLYNQGVTDAQTFLRDRLADLEASCYEPEFAYWPKSGAVRRK